MYGGYFKEVSSDKNASEKGTVHADMWSLDPRTWEWNKVNSCISLNIYLLSSVPHVHDVLKPSWQCLSFSSRSAHHC
jgi:hypothetical protein